MHDFFPILSHSRQLLTDVLQHFEPNGWDSDFLSFDPPASFFYYRDPVIYAQIRSIIGKQEMEKVAQTLKDCLCYFGSQHKINGQSNLFRMLIEKARNGQRT